MQNKHITRLSFLGVILIIIANIVLYRQFVIENVILREISANNKYLVDRYKTGIWNLSPKVIKKLRTTSHEELSKDREFVSFIKNSADFFQTGRSIKVQIFDQDGNEFFSSNKLTIDAKENDNSSLYEYLITKLDYAILKESIDYEGLTKAYQQKTYITTLLPKTSITTDNDETKIASLIVDYIPIIGPSSKVDAVVVMYNDATELWHNIGRLERRALTAFAIFFALFFLIIIYNTRYAQNIINQQSQINKLLREAKAKAEKESSSKTMFLANVSHELRTPLNSIIGFSEIILSEQGNKLTKQQYVDYVNDIYNSGKHLLAVINDILDYSKATTHKLQVDMMEVDLNKIAISSMRFFEPKAKESKILLVRDIPNEHIIIVVDPKRLKQALLNLLSNAVKFTNAHGCVTLSISKNEEEKLVYIKVIDTGRGIEESDIPKALSSFEQVDNKKNRQYEGTGLGLPLTKKLVELMGGIFEITSIIKVGTTVTLTFSYQDNLA